MKTFVWRPASIGQTSTLGLTPSHGFPIVGLVWPEDLQLLKQKFESEAARYQAVIKNLKKLPAAKLEPIAIFADRPQAEDFARSYSSDGHPFAPGNFVVVALLNADGLTLSILTQRPVS